jgi:hypothetical protein
MTDTQANVQQAPTGISAAVTLYDDVLQVSIVRYDGPPYSATSRTVFRDTVDLDKGPENEQGDQLRWALRTALTQARDLLR